MMQPPLETARLQLRPAVRGDLASLHALWCEPAVYRFLFDDQAPTQEVAASVLESCLECADAGHGLWLLHAKGDAAALAGCVGLLPTTNAAGYEPALAGLLEPLAALAPAWQHRGLAHEALVAVLDHAFAALHQERVAAVNDVPNVASARMLARLGFQVLGETQGPRYRLRTYLLARTAWRRKAPVAPEATPR